MADTPDFSKIWGSNGNVTYKFTDDNYLTGWSFVGDTPPARGMFDKFFMGTDTKLKYLYDRLNANIDKTYTVDDTKAPTSNTEQLLATLSELAHMIKTAGGTSDWKTTPATNLATMATLVSNLASGSDVTWDGKKFTNSKLGITGLMDTNGYIAFGPNFGGLIIQWGKENTTALKYSVSFPLAYRQFVHVIPYDITGTSGDAFTAAVLSITNNSFTVTTDSADRALGAFGWISIGV